MLPTIALTRWSIDMSAQKTLPISAATRRGTNQPRPPSEFLSIRRCIGGFTVVVESHDHGAVPHMIAVNVIELVECVATWASPPAKKR